MDVLKRYQGWIALTLALLVGIGDFLIAPPTDFLPHTTFTVARGESVSAVAKELEEAHIIKHASIFRFLLRVSGRSTHLQAGIYLFDTRQTLLTVAYRLVTGAYDHPPVQITFPEGMTVRDISLKVADILSPAVAADLVTLGKSQEGYLFPDTYFFNPDVTAASVIATMRSNFDTKMAPLMSDIQASGHSLGDIVTLASLVEKEARTPVNKRIVAGILWNRLARNMPLQVDAVFGYIFDRDTYSPSLADLTVDSPYNTYTHTKLPPGPICNPGLVSIDAVLHPTKTNYLYYLTDRNGVMHYATTYAAHQAHQAKYLH